MLTVELCSYLWYRTRSETRDDKAQEAQQKIAQRPAIERLAQHTPIASHTAVSGRLWRDIYFAFPQQRRWPSGRQLSYRVLQRERACGEARVENPTSRNNAVARTRVEYGAPSAAYIHAPVACRSIS